MLIVFETVIHVVQINPFIKISLSFLFGSCVYYGCQLAQEETKQVEHDMDFWGFSSFALVCKQLKI